MSLSGSGWTPWTSKFTIRQKIRTQSAFVHTMRRVPRLKHRHKFGVEPSNKHEAYQVRISWQSQVYALLPSSMREIVWRMSMSANDAKLSSMLAM